MLSRILTHDRANLSANTVQVQTLVDPESFLPHLLAPMVNLSVCAPVIPDGVETMSGVSSSIYSLAAMIKNYLALVLYKGSLTGLTGDGHSSLGGSVENLSCDGKTYSCLAPLYHLSSGSHL